MKPTLSRRIVAEFTGTSWVLGLWERSWQRSQPCLKNIEQPGDETVCCFGRDDESLGW